MNKSIKGSSRAMSFNFLRLRMKILILFLTGFMLTGIPVSVAQVIDFENDFSGTTLSEFITFVEKSTEYKFFLNNSEVETNQIIALPKGEKDVLKAIDDVMDELELSYQIAEDKSIMIVSENADVQDIEISGVVTDQKTKEPLLGVSVAIPGTAKGTITDIDGKYLLKAPSNGKLSFSFIGYETYNVNVNNKKVINVELSASAVNLDEIVMIGYGTTTKRKAVGAITTMKAEKLEATPYANVGNALQGQVSGLIVSNNGGGPGSVPSISIRGGGEPLYVIDGVITSEQDFNTINSEDIQSISFLKDAAATAVYGARGGNGIVLVTTKKGEKGTLSVNYSYNYQMSQPTVLPEMMNSYEYAKLQNDAALYDGDAVVFDDATLDIIKNHTDLDAYPDNNWPELALKDFAPSINTTYR